MTEAFTLIALVLMLAVIVYDMRKLIIPNKLNLLILALFPAWYFLAPQPLDIVSSAMMFGVFLLAGFGLYAVKVLGAGDVKLLAVLGLYTGWNASAIALVFNTAIFGGVMALAFIILRRILKNRPQDSLPLILQKGKPIPYGPAIAVAFAMLVVQGRLPGM